MAGRGDNNKHGTSGQGSSNQSNQPFGADAPSSNHNKQKTGGQPSEKQEKTRDKDAYRNDGVATDTVTSVRNDERSFNLLIDKIPYSIKATPFSFNDELRYYVSVNGGEEHVFTWDSEISGLRAIDDQSATLPEAVEEAISQKLQALKK